MVLRALLGSAGVTISLKPGSVVVGIDDREVVAWDRAGRLYSVVSDGHTFRRGLNGRVLEKWQENGRQLRRWPAGEQAARVVDEAAGLASRVAGGVAAGRLAWEAAPAPELRSELIEVLERAAQFDAGAAAADAARFAHVYQPVGILPPDQYLSVVVQATEGCSFNTCTFCRLYQNPYRVRSVVEFDTHVAAVRAYLADSLRLRDRSVFLGAANALATPMARLVPLLEVIGRQFDPARPRIGSFVDGFTGAMKSADDYRLLAALGLTRVYIGLESGHDPLLEFVRKPATSRQALETVRAVKAGGLSVAVIVLLGLGGDRFADAHVEDTAERLSAMDLGADDIVYLSALVEAPGAAYPTLALERGIHPLTSEQMQAQRQAITRSVSYADDPPKFVSYHVDEFVY